MSRIGVIVSVVSGARPAAATGSEAIETFRDIASKHRSAMSLAGVAQRGALNGDQ
jgi:hypothetical protein